MADIKVGMGRERKTKRRTGDGASRGKKIGDPSAPAKAGATAKPEPRVSGSGVERLRQAAERRLARKSEELADLLLEKALEGKLEGARMLVALAEKKKPRAKRGEGPWKGKSVAEMLAEEPEWVEPEVGDVWDGDGWTKQGTGESVERGGRVRVEAE